MLRIQWLKNADLSTVLRCTRDDGSCTWQKQTKHAAHFILHDLTHYAVETSLGYVSGFFGLIAAGWDIEDTTGKGARGDIPTAALEVEKIVGIFDTERAAGLLWTSDEINQFSPRALSPAEIDKVRALRGILFQRWFAIAPGDKLELTFGSQD